MFGTPIELVDMARDVSLDLTDQEKISLAVEMILTVRAGGNGPALRAAARQIDQHAQMLGRGEGAPAAIRQKEGGGVMKRESIGFFDLETAKRISSEQRKRRLVDGGQAASRPDVVDQAFEVHSGACFTLLKRRIHLVFSKLKGFFCRTWAKVIGGRDV